MKPSDFEAWRQYAAAALSGLLIAEGQGMWGDTPEARELCQRAMTFATAMMEVEEHQGFTLEADEEQ